MTLRAIEGASQELLRQQAIARQLPFHAQVIGSHWSKKVEAGRHARVQIDVVAGGGLL